MRVAFVYDRVNKLGGAERVLLALHELWPKAPLYTSVYNRKLAGWADEFQVIPSFLNQIPGASTRHELLATLMPLAFESFDFADYDLVISVTSEAAKGIITKPGTRHLCYCLTPTRYLYSGYDQYFHSALIEMMARPFVKYLRAWDKIAAHRPDQFIAISDTVRQRVKNYYQQEAEVVYPPVDTDFFKPDPSKILSTKRGPGYFLVVSRLVAYKRIDLAVRAFNLLGLRLKIIGTGQQMHKLKKMAENNVEFLGSLTDEQVLSYYQKCQAVIFTAEEDFGLVPLEAQACGRPVIAFRGGGALETIIDGETGVFFDRQDKESLIEVIKSFQSSRYQWQKCRHQAEGFSKKMFKRRLKKTIKEAEVKK